MNDNLIIASVLLPNSDSPIPLPNSDTLAPVSALKLSLYTERPIKLALLRSDCAARICGN